ncbi:DUF4124 domain-containing protein [uncultured Marinobacter sp.]|uniref:DUF4124 domain-containing protein n=1 Tax=uncultured Marinobacter sp. TaxID=187379 RepID=UPI00262BF19D|nr:DUF4124 domain-containing protein [uncultured Marinobacter sp.]
MNKRILTLAIILAAVPLAASGASVYKWTDENGVTHFGDRQPTGQQAEQVNVRSGTSSGGQKGQSPQEQLEELEARQADEAEKREESAVEEARRKQREANCETARSNLRILDRNSRIRVEEEGEQRYLSPEEIDEQRQKFQEIADENCGAEEDAPAER